MRKWTLLIGCVAIVVIVGTALGSSGTPASTRPVTYDANGVLNDKLKTNADRIKLQTKDPTNVVIQTITYHAGAASGWHHHPGFVLLVVKSGQLKFHEADCSVRTLNPGDVMLESGDDGPGNLRNESGADAEIGAAFVAPKVGSGSTADRVLRIEDAARCGLNP
jgi:quercetin dioxygenase-like cupin family protein